MAIRKTRLKWKKKMRLFAIICDLLRLFPTQPATATSPKSREQPNKLIQNAIATLLLSHNKNFESVLVIKE